MLGDPALPEEVRPADEGVHGEGGEPRAEEVARDVRHVVRLVADHGRGGREDDVARAGALDAEVGEEEVVVGDDHLSAPELAPGVHGEARVIEAALRAVAELGNAVHAVPDGVGGLEGEVGEVARFGLAAPLADLLPVAELLPFERDGRQLSRGLVVAVEAEVVVDPLDESVGELAREEFRERGEVFLEDLLLESDVRRADDDARVGRDRLLDRRDEVGVGLSDPAGGLDREMVLFRDLPLDGSGHLDLSAARLVCARFLFEEPARPEHFGDHEDRIYNTKTPRTQRVRDEPFPA